MSDTPQEIINMLSPQPQPALPWYARWFAFLTTPFKFLGIDGWANTGLSATATGTLIRDAAHSTDGFYTVDIQLTELAMQGSSYVRPSGRYIRLEVEPGTIAHVYAKLNINKLIQGANIITSGEIYVDTDGPFLEIHPTDVFALV